MRTAIESWYQTVPASFPLRSVYFYQMPVHETSLRVRYAETDQMGVAYYSNHFIWMEVGRVELCRSIGFNYKDMEAEDGILLAVVDAHCEYRFPVCYDDELIVKTWIGAARPRGIEFRYEMRRAADGRVIAKGETRHIFCGRDMKPAKLPEKYYSAFGIGKPLECGSST